MVLVLSMHDEDLYAERALRAGARGYVMKREASRSVILAIRRMREGKIAVSERVAESLAARFVTGAPVSEESAGHAAQRSRAGGVPPDRRRTRHA